MIGYTFRELWAAILDTIHCGDLRGHLAAWLWSVRTPNAQDWRGL